MKSSKISQTKKIHFNSRYRFFRALATLLCLLASCYPSLSLRAIVPTGKIVQSWKFLSIPMLFTATFNGIIRWKLKSLADTIVVIITLKILRLSEWGLLNHLHTRRQGKPAAISLETWGSYTCNLLLQGHSSSNGSCHIRSRYLRHHSPSFTGRSHLHTRGYDTTALVARQYILQRRTIVRKLFQ